MYRILVIDDDIELCKLIKETMLSENIKSDICYSGEEGISFLEKNEYQLIILDIMLPAMDGFETLGNIRSLSNIPVLMLTSKADNISKVQGLRSGADDYLTKPFDLDELIARVLALIRRYTRLNYNNEKKSNLEFEGLKVDLESHLIETYAGKIELPPKEFDILVLLAENQGKILTKKKIYENVWGEEYIYDDSNIMAIISRLRKKIEPRSEEPKYIQTIKGVGYRFSKEV